MKRTFLGRISVYHLLGMQIATLAVMAVLTAPAMAQVTYSITSLAPRNETSFGWAINKKAEVAGWHGTETGAHAFLYSGGTLNDIGTLGGADSYGNALNDKGEVVGESEVASGPIVRHAFLYTNGVMIDLSALAGGTPGNAAGIDNRGSVVCNFNRHTFLYSEGTMTELGTFVGTCINKHGQIAGYSNDVAVLYSDGILTELGSLGGMGSAAYGINDRGEIVGASATGRGSGGAFLWSDGGMIDLGTTTNTLPYSFAFGINNRGDVVGEVYNPRLNIYHAFVYQKGKMVDLNATVSDGSGLVLENAMDINDSGEIIANGNYGDGRNHAFLLKPVHKFGKGELREADPLAVVEAPR